MNETIVKLVTRAIHGALFPGMPALDSEECDVCPAAARAAIAAHTAALTEAGLVIVPKVASEAMISAGWDAEATHCCHADLGSLASVWEAMITKALEE